MRLAPGVRQPSVELPPTFNFAVLANEGKLIRWMLAHDPKARPSAADLLARSALRPRSARAPCTFWLTNRLVPPTDIARRSGHGAGSDLMPPPQRDSIDDAIRTVTDPKSPYFGRLLEGRHVVQGVLARARRRHQVADIACGAAKPCPGSGRSPALFRQSGAVGVDLLDDGVGAATSASLYRQTQVAESIVRVFRRHGAVELTVTDLVPQAYVCRRATRPDGAQKSLAPSSADAAPARHRRVARGRGRARSLPRLPASREIQPVPVLGQGGQLLLLPFDATLMFAQFLARSAVDALRRYSVTNVRRGGGRASDCCQPSGRGTAHGMRPVRGPRRGRACWCR